MVASPVPEIEVRPATSRRERALFLALPRRLYAADETRDPRWTEIHEQTSGPLVESAREILLAWRGRRLIGGMFNYFNDGGALGLFGGLVAEDEAAVVALIAAARTGHRAAGRTGLRGPWDPSGLPCAGAMVAGFAEPAALLQRWDPPHVARGLAASGMRAVAEVATYWNEDVTGLCLSAEDPRVRGLVAEDLEAVMRAIDRAFAGMWGFESLVGAERARAVNWLSGLDLGLSAVVVVDGEVVGVALVVVDRGRAIVCCIAVDARRRGGGLMRAVLAGVLRAAQRRGVRTMDTTWIHADNAASRACAQIIFKMRVKQRMVVFEEAL